MIREADRRIAHRADRRDPHRADRRDPHRADRRDPHRADRREPASSGKDDAVSTDDALARLRLPHYPRTNRYDPEWILRNLMGPNPLWLMESLLDHMQLEPGMRVLDLGCGRAVTSIFLAKETGATVFATALWIDAAGNWRRIREAGAEDLVVPIHAEAHALPFANSFFDAVVSVDAYHYFGTDQLYLPALAELVRPGGRI